MASVVLSGCSREQPAPQQPIRAVKVEAVSDIQDDTRRFTGVVRQRQSAELAFESGGRLTQLQVDVGDAIKAGQLLAALDQQPALLRLQQAQASVRFENAKADERRNNLQRQNQLFVAGNVAQVVVQEAAVGYQQALAEQHRAESDLALANREVERSRMFAPFAGRVVARRSERFAQLAAGQVVLEVEASNDQQVIAAVPTDQANRLKVGDRAFAFDARSGSDGGELVLEGVSPRAEDGLVQTCIFRLRRSSAKLPSGLTVLVTMNAPMTYRLTVPVQSLRMGAQDYKAQVFIYQPGSGTVAVRNVSITAINNGRAQIQDGVASGELVVTAGVAFLTDGQAVSLFQSTSRLARN
ncbi:secretion protein HlyD [Pseudomonas viridiflava]|nr:secretion protein HlyD [Pseudomonas viridiflava]